MIYSLSLLYVSAILLMIQLLMFVTLNYVLHELEINADLAVSWFESNYMKLNSDKCHLLVSGHKHEQTFIKINSDIIWQSREVKLLGIKIDNSLKFDNHISDLCMKEIGN